MNSADIVGWAKDGALYCPGCKPASPDNPVFLDGAQPWDTCDTCGEFLEGCEPDPVANWAIAGQLYEILQQDEYFLVRKTDRAGGQTWLRHPERTFETESGANYAVLLDLEGQSKQDALGALIEALEDSIPEEDEDGNGHCDGCGREFEEAQTMCVSDDCRFVKARAALKLAKGE